MTSSTIKPSLTVSSPSIQKSKLRLIISLNSIALIGVGIAIYQALTGQIGLLEIGLFLFMMTISVLGITVGYHRYFAHKAFKTTPTIRIMLAILGSIAAQGPINVWVATHRCHHQYSDKMGDFHSPCLHGEDFKGKLKGLWHAHIGWLFDEQLPNTAIFAKDLIQDSAIAKINRLYLVWIVLGILIPTVLGGLLTYSWHGAFQGFIWGGIARMAWSCHGGYTINSIAHVFGQTFLKSDDHSKNNIWLAIPTYGEGWHNNHHAFPHSAKFGLKWWQVDLGFWFIQILQFLGLAWDVKIPTDEMIEAKRINKIT